MTTVTTSLHSTLLCFSLLPLLAFGLTSIILIQNILLFILSLFAVLAEGASIWCPMLHCLRCRIGASQPPPLARSPRPCSTSQVSTSPLTSPLTPRPILPETAATTETPTPSPPVSLRPGAVLASLELCPGQQHSSSARRQS
jgi:hypothetical protein